MATKKDAVATAPNELVLKIGNLTYKLPKGVTSQQKVKTAVKSIMLYSDLDIKTTYITLPNGVKITYKQLSNIKEFCKLLLTGVYLIPANLEEGARLLEIMHLITQNSSKKTISWDNVGNNSIEYGAELFSNAIQELVTLEAVTAEEAEYFTEMINDHKNQYHAK